MIECWSVSKGAGEGTSHSEGTECIHTVGMKGRRNLKGGGQGVAEDKAGEVGVKGHILGSLVSG